MSFINTRFLDAYIALGSSAGARYQTEITELSSGEEQRNQAWSYPRHRYLVGISAGTSEKIEQLRQLHHSTRGRFNGFRFKDFNDYSSAANSDTSVTFNDQSLGAGDGVTTTYQVIKSYSAGSETATRLIRKLVSGTFILGFRGGSWSLEDTGNRWSVNVNTGIVTFLADIQKTITNAVSIGSGQTRITAVAHGAGSAGTLHLSTFTGDWAGMNDRRVQIVSSLLDSIDVTFDSSSYAAYSGNAGQLNTLPQATEQVVWGGEFDVPVRFANDEIQVEKVSPGIERASIELIELKNPQS